jgi:hypothetical protein
MNLLEQKNLIILPPSLQPRNGKDSEKMPWVNSRERLILLFFRISARPKKNPLSRADADLQEIGLLPDIFIGTVKKSTTENSEKCI